MAGLLSRPGMTHAMSAGAGRGVRIPRPLTGPGGAMDVLGRDWERAVKAASRSGPRPGSDPGWRERSLSTLSAVTATLRAMRAGRVGFVFCQVVIGQCGVSFPSEKAVGFSPVRNWPVIARVLLFHCIRA